ncbi:MAG: glycoside hydrolase family 2 protein [Planctomycetes bacterium]|nr:glycoside hydrolase family 2 protein [Planctomycetota bacterium]
MPAKTKTKAKPSSKTASKTPSSADGTLALDGAWSFRCPQPRGQAPKGLRLDAWMPIAVPGTVHIALQKLKKIPDPYIDRNELAVQWIDDQDWEFQREFSASDDDCARARQELVFDGLDTVCEIRLNGTVVGASENMFRQVVCDVHGALKPGRNRLTILFASPTRHGLKLYEAAGKISDPGDFIWQTGERRDTGRNWIRKVQCHFGWDWGVCLATSGPWQPSRLECSDAPRIASIQVAQRHEGPVGAPERVVLDLTVRLEAARETAGEIAVSWIDPGVDDRGGTRQDGGFRIDQQRHQLAIGENRVATSITIDDPQLWWPNGAGAQPLYEIGVRWTGEDGASVEATRRIGLRTIELVTEDDTSSDGKPAQSFFFRVNGRAIYVKGANWIPADQFVERCTPKVYRHLLGAMTEAHMNMVRVWGGGWYEQESFYDLCDELGLMVWQDFMMACAPHPDTPGFLRELTAEAVYQVRRLQHRACVALWCGDNENLGGSKHWWGARPGQAERFGAMYRNLMTTLRNAVEPEDATRRFWLSSPSNGDFDGNPDDPLRGDVHYWAVWHGKLPFANYLTVKPRFASEFGFQSFPEPRTVDACVPAEARNPSSRVMEHHQRSPDGNLMITNTMARELPIPHGFESFCWASQINQAMAIRTAVEHWRRSKPWTMGTIYWQVNDLWPVASWSSIDWHGRWKALHHAAVRFHAPLLASITHADGKVQVWVTSDVPAALPLAGTLEVYTWTGRKIASKPLKAKLLGDESRAIATFEVAALLAGKAEPHEVCLFVTLAGGGQSAENFATLAPWKWAALPRPRLRDKLAQRRDGTLELTLSCREVAAFVHAELEGLEGHFTGDWNVLRPGATYRLNWVPHSECGATMPTLREARRRLKLFSLYDLSEH